MALEITVSSLKQTVSEKDDEISRLEKQCDELEKLNQELKDEQESLKTVNKLTYEDLNRVNSDLRAEVSDIGIRRLMNEKNCV
jgi:predicted RNase H-like nuclease (RuvC/YqgF family)